MKTSIAVLLFLGLALALIDDASARRRWWHRHRHDDSRDEDCERRRPPLQEDGRNFLCRYRCAGGYFRYGREEDGTPCVSRLRRPGLCYGGRCVSERRYERLVGETGKDDVTDRPERDEDVTDRTGPGYDVTDRPEQPKPTQDPDYDYRDDEEVTFGPPKPTPKAVTTSFE
ncbi:uncharacterized protein LOC135385868 [Ornithodoros turicata]|uniref:uncharacterized protein LOC135385868 n=1 Tax=Ornithodoros turicata TaxID=34597 RepID=UPI003139C9E1